MVVVSGSSRRAAAEGIGLVARSDGLKRAQPLGERERERETETES